MDGTKLIHKNVTFTLDRDLIGLALIVTQAPARLPGFDKGDIDTVVAHFNTHAPAELAYPPGYPPHRANFTIVTEAMVRNALEAIVNKTAQSLD